MTGAELSAILAGNVERALAHEDAFVGVLVREFEREAARAARQFRRRVTQHGLMAAAGVTSSSTMIAVYPSPEEAVSLAQPNGEPAEILHVTLAYLGEVGQDVAEAAVAAVGPVAAAFEPLSGVVGGVGAFGNLLADLARVADRVAPDGGYGDTGWDPETSTVVWVPADWTAYPDDYDAVQRAFLAVEGVERVEFQGSETTLSSELVPVYRMGRPVVDVAYPSIALPDVPGLAELRNAVCQALDAAGIEYAENHGWTPHITLAYTPEPSPPPAWVAGMPLSFDRLSVTRGDVPRDFEFGDALLAAGPPDWSSPHPDEVIDVESLVAALRTKSDPVRRAAIEELGRGLPIDWDVTNPFVGRVLARSASQVTHIAQTTRLNVMRSIRKAYEQGLSIPDTAKLIRSGMSAAGPARARLIARTELAGVANGGAVAAAQLVARATGITYYKTWMTAIGAEHPRHETYFGLNGQTTTMTGLFTVGTSQLAYPGDLSGPIRETANCRCSVSFTETPSAPAMEPVQPQEPRKAARVPRPDAAALAAIRARRMGRIEHKEWASQNGLSEEEYVQKLEGEAAAIAAGAEVRIRVFADTLERVLRERRFKNQFETGTSTGLLDTEGRALAEKKMFGIAQDAPAEARPVYGYLSTTKPSRPGFDHLAGYGATIVRLKAGVRERTTFSSDDSLFNGQHGYLTPPPLTEPSADAIVIQKDEVGKLLSGRDPGDDVAYHEAQIHGGVSIDDIEEIVFTTAVPERLEARLRELGIPFRHDLNFERDPNFRG